VITRTDEIKSQYSMGAKPKAAKQSDDVRGGFFSHHRLSTPERCTFACMTYGHFTNLMPSKVLSFHQTSI
jgi:hypothetical protein